MSENGCFDAEINDNGTYVCPKCKEVSGTLGIITHRYDCTNKGLKICQKQYVDEDEFEDEDKDENYRRKKQERMDIKNDDIVFEYDGGRKRRRNKTNKKTKRSKKTKKQKRSTKVRKTRRHRHRKH